MKHGVFKNGYIKVGNKDLSDHCSEMSLTLSAADVPAHAMGDDYEYNLPGLFRVACTARFLQDFAAASVDATLQPLYAARANFALVLKADNGTTTTTNPAYSGLAFISSYKPVGGAHGANLESEVTFSPAGNWSRVTT